jgi:hypothetical protein
MDDGLVLIILEVIFCSFKSKHYFECKIWDENEIYLY